MLLGAGAGSALAGKLVRTARWPALGVVIFAVLTCWSGWFLAPLAVALGMMFPVGFARVGEEQAPWAWGVNGCASVIGATLGSVLAMDLGFNVVLVLAAGLYAMAAVAFRWLR
jgi:hypothetical protein